MTTRLGGPLLLVGAGKMGGALLTGWLAEGLDPRQIFVQDPKPPPEVAALIDQSGVSVGVPGSAPSVLVLAVKPQMMDEVLPGLKPFLGKDTVVLSIAAGRTIAGIARHLGPEAAIVRSMPNTPAAIGRGITVAVANAHVTNEQAERCAMLLAAGGEVEWVDDEAALDPVTAVSGSGPAYVFLLTECLAQAGQEAGLEPALARRLARATVAGAGELMRRADLDPAELRHNVTSPGGTTAAALDVLMGEGGFRELLAEAVEKAAARSKALSS